MLLVIITIVLATIIALCGYIYSITLPKGKLTNTFVKITVGHRGCRWISPVEHKTVPEQDDPDQPQIIPENSMPSFQRAVDFGCKAVELDCRLTADGNVVVMHDDIIARVTTKETLNGKKFISDMTLTEIKTLRYKNWNDTDAIPTLEEVLVWAKSADVKVFVELKSLTLKESHDLAQKVAQLFTKLKAYEYCCVIAFHPVAVYYTRLYQPLIEVCILYCRDFFRWGVVNKAERSHWWGPFAGIMDRILLRITPTLVPLVTGCQLVGPDLTLLDKADIEYYHNKLNVGIYGWVANTIPDHDFFISRGCSVGTDFVFPRRVNPYCIMNQIHRDNMLNYISTAQLYLANDPTLVTQRVVAQGIVGSPGKATSNVDDYLEDCVTGHDPALEAPIA